MKIIISQPMRGKTDKEIQVERIPIIQKLIKEGHEVVDTIFTEDAPKDCHAGLWYLAKSIEKISKVDGVVFMKGWQNARGCIIEERCARQYGKFVRYEE